MFKNLAFIALCILSSCKDAPVNQIAFLSTEVETPFENFTVSAPGFKACDSLFITDFGAAKTDKDANSKAIQDAMTTASNTGCGVVVIPEGVWETKKIHFKSNVNLHLKEGAVLQFSEDPQDYLPAVHTTWEGMECYNYSPLIYAYECENIAITGNGTLKAKMDVWKTWFSRPEAHMQSLKRLYHLAASDAPVESRNMVNDTSNLRPQFIQFNRSKTILIEGISIENSPFWTIHPYLSKDVTIRDINVFAHGHNNDGVDPEMSENVLIENCVFDQGDDALAVKSGRNQDAWRLNTPSKNIVMRKCTVKNGHQLMAIGSELSGGIENVFVTDCEVDPQAKMFHLAFIKTNERRGGYVKNIAMATINAGTIEKGIFGIETDVLYQWRDLVPTLERRLTPIENIQLKDIHVTNTGYISSILGQEELPVRAVELINVTADSISAEKHIHENALEIEINTTID